MQHAIKLSEVFQVVDNGRAQFQNSAKYHRNSHGSSHETPVKPQSKVESSFKFPQEISNLLVRTIRVEAKLPSCKKLLRISLLQKKDFLKT